MENHIKRIHSTENDCEDDEKLSIPEEILEKLGNSPEIVEFISKLIKYIEMYRYKIKHLEVPNKSYKSVLVQTDSEKADQNSSENIVEEIKDAAEEAMKNSGFVYEETSGMYYDYNTGYYYNAEYGLYYDGNTGTYMEFNPETKSYVYHSQIAHFNPEKPKVKRKHRFPKARKRAQRPRKIVEEEGECSTETTGSDSSASSISQEDTSSSDLTKQWPPCMRVIILETTVPKLKIGSLHMITFEGGSIGREGNHAILIPDINISKHHLNISFNKESNCYQATDMGSRNGTVLNGVRMAPSKQESVPFDVVHGSKIQLGSTVLLCHVHEGYQTCGHCEPGLINTNTSNTTSEIEVGVAQSAQTKSEVHKNELKNLKKKFGMSWNEDDGKLASGYTDRAQRRRETVGSQNPHEKTQTASVETSIDSGNKGFKLLSKMGWKEGTSLGKGQGILEPVNVITNQNIQLTNSKSSSSHHTEAENRSNIWKRTQERFDKLT